MSEKRNALREMEVAEEKREKNAPVDPRNMIVRRGNGGHEMVAKKKAKRKFRPILTMSRAQYCAHKLSEAVHEMRQPACKVGRPTSWVRARLCRYLTLCP